MFIFQKTDQLFSKLRRLWRKAAQIQFIFKAKDRGYG